MEASIYFRVLAHCHFNKERLLIEIERVRRAGNSSGELESDLKGLMLSTRTFSLGCIGHDSGRTRLVELPHEFLAAHRVLIEAPAGSLMGYPASDDGAWTAFDREQSRLRAIGP